MLCLLRCSINEKSQYESDSTKGFLLNGDQCGSYPFRNNLNCSHISSCSHRRLCVRSALPLSVVDVSCTPCTGPSQPCTGACSFIIRLQTVGRGNELLSSVRGLPYGDPTTMCKIPNHKNPINPPPMWLHADKTSNQR